MYLELFVVIITIYFIVITILWTFPGGSDSKESSCQCRRPGFDPWVGMILWRKQWLTSSLENSMDRGAWLAYSPWTRRIGYD